MIEGLYANTGHTFWNRNGCQVSAFKEGHVADAYYTVWNCDRGQACAGKSMNADACHAIRNCNRF